MRNLVLEYDKRLGEVAQVKGEDPKVTLLTADTRSLVRQGELAGAFDGSDFSEKARCMRCRYMYDIDTVFDEPSLATLRQKEKWPDYEKQRGVVATRVGKCAEADMDAECEEALEKKREEEDAQFRFHLLHLCLIAT
jgi:hypothetical protein